MKKQVAIILCLCLLFSGCGLFPAPQPGSGAAEGTSQSVTQEDPSESSPAVTEPGQPETDAADREQIPLLDAELSLVLTELPAEAFQSGGANSCRGMAPDGVTFLMTDGTAPYLYNIETASKMDLVPADAAAEEQVRDQLLRLAQNGADAAAAAKAAEEIEAISREELTEALCSFSIEDGTPKGPIAYGFGFYTEENYLLAYCNNAGPLPLLVDCNTGEYRVILEYGTLTSVQNGRALFTPLPPGAAVTIMDLETGTVVTEDFTEAGGFEDGAAMKTASFLPDGSICAVLRDINMDLKNGEDCAAVVRTADGKDEVYPLGKIMFGKEPDLIIAAEPDHIILQCRTMVRNRCPYMVDRHTAEVSVLSVRDMQVTATPLSQLLQENGAVPDDAQQGSFIPLDVFFDEQTVLLWGTGQGEMLLYRPSSGETKGAAPDEYNSYPAPVTFTGNHSDRFWMNGLNGFTDYTQLVVK